MTGQTKTKGHDAGQQAQCRQAQWMLIISFSLFHPPLAARHFDRRLFNHRLGLACRQHTPHKAGAHHLLDFQISLVVDQVAQFVGIRL